MPDVKVTIPDAWITEWNVLYLVPRAYERPTSKAERANAILAEWDYPFQLSPRVFWPDSLDTLYVDPAHIADEQWPSSAYTRDRTDGWVRVHRVDLESLAADDEVRRHDPCGPIAEEDCAECSASRNDEVGGPS